MSLLSTISSDQPESAPFLDREGAAEHCGFLPVTFSQWLRAGLLPAPAAETGKWRPEALDEALDRLARCGFEPSITANAKRGNYVALPNVHRTPRINSEGIKKFHHYRRRVPAALPGKPGSPEFMVGLIQKERLFASRQQESESKSASLPTHHRPPTATDTHVEVERISSEPSRGVPWLPSPPISELRVAPRRGLSRVESAMYIGVSPSKFDQMVMDGRMPKPRRIDARKVWDVRDIDVAFDALPSENPHSEGSTWDDFRAT